MDIILYVLIFCIGIVFGSFFTLAIYRIPLGKNITHERSYCPKCNHKLSFFDMIPLASYIFLGGRCRYCKEPIRICYFLLELFSGIIFVLFALSIKLSLFTTTISILVYFVFGLLYIASLFIIAGIDSEKRKVQSSVLLFAIIMSVLYMLYLYIVEEANIYRYIIYLFLLCIFVLIDTVILRKKAKNSYPLEVLMLCMLMVLFTYEACTILTIIFTLLAVAIQVLLHKITEIRKKYKKKDKTEAMPIPIAFYLSVCNIIMLVITNTFVFYRW